ncbi:hypothetical protein TanjilG_11569 [Lupinus angustifolius]|uniref:DUF3444 domain-containing protein n=1 Tax=Lupinus angustifolius TaxID=3871 RepID=A0A1J7H5P1_LUPAN|nr:hypothetical protein TanjilG_11569 [Lupinus angustifolius]
MKTEVKHEKVRAIHEQSLAAIMMLHKEYTGARQKLIIAQKIYPELENISLKLTICEILLLASSLKLSHIMSCILDLICPSSTCSDARCYFSDLVNSINGIKNEFPGAELAQEIVQNALNMLSDRENNMYYGLEHDDNDFISPDEILDGENIESASTWESCRDIINADIPLEQSSLEESMVQDPEYPEHEFYNFQKERSIELFEPGQIWAANYQPDETKQCRYAKIYSKNGDVLSVTWLKPVLVGGSDESIWSNVGLSFACGAFHHDPNTCYQVRTRIFSYKCSSVSDQTGDQIEIYPKIGEIWAVYKDGIANACNPQGLGCNFELIEMFSDYSKCTGCDFTCLVKVNGFRSVFKRLTCGTHPVLFHISPNRFLFSHKIPAHRLVGGKDEALFELDQMALPNNLIQQIEEKLCVEQLQLEGKFLDYRKSACDFATGQVWAIYCGKDTTPHQYAIINKVVSNRQVQSTLLEPEAIHEYETKWRQDLPVACGTFKHGNTNVIFDISQFSHLVNYMKSTTRPHYIIYPLKGEVWAMYKNWKRNWDYSDYEQCKYWLVEIISDFSKENGMKVAKLKEVHNCQSLFQRQQHEGFDISCTVFEEDILCFSHRVPAYKVAGVEKYGIPKDSWHLEPHALTPHHKVKNIILKPQAIIPHEQKGIISATRMHDSSNNFVHEPIQVQMPNEDESEPKGARVQRATRKPEYLKDYM